MEETNKLILENIIEAKKDINRLNKKAGSLYERTNIIRDKHNALLNATAKFNRSYKKDRIIFAGVTIGLYMSMVGLSIRVAKLEAELEEEKSKKG